MRSRSVTGAQRVLGAALIAAAFAVALSAGGADGAKSKPPKTGIYGAMPTKPEEASYKPGAWVVVKDGGKLKMVRYPEYSAIFFPERTDGCNPYTLGLPDESVPVSKSGRFHVKEEIPIGGTDDALSVDWKGRWTTPSKVKGTVKLGLGKCHETVPWTGKRSGPVPSG
ncbi:MAG: hypothetical protein U0R24_13540 [Solirubrobacterales bacterium]